MERLTELESFGISAGEYARRRAFRQRQRMRALRQAHIDAMKTRSTAVVVMGRSFGTVVETKSGRAVQIERMGDTITLPYISIQQRRT